jgi:hypothetical protein
VKNVNSDGCLDADTLAAWADDELDRDARRAAETHAADCARCQALLAAMVRSAPVAAPVAAPFWRSWRTLGWLVPVTTAAAAVIVWTIAPQRAPRSQEAANDRLAAARPAAHLEPSPSPSRAPAGSDARRAETSAEKSTETSAAKDEAAKAAPAAAPPAPPPLARPVEAPSATSVLRSAGAARAFALDAAVAPAVLIVSPDPASRWRIVSGRVEHSADGGSTWESQQTGSTVTPAAGSAPSASVCWLVGPGGTVLLSTDGRTWQRITFPESADLVGVRATDDKNATVTVATGAAYSTTDGGLTWKR